MIQAIIDIGSNTIRLAIYQIAEGNMNLVMKKKNLVGLAAYIKEGKMQSAGIAKAAVILKEYKEFLEFFQIHAVTAFTTAALRNAKNSADAIRQITEASGVPIRVLSGDEEATYDFIGATHDLTSPDGLLIDIGGASTEIVVYKDHHLCQKVSLPIGSLALHTEKVESLLPVAEEIASMRMQVIRVLEKAEDFKDIRHTDICGIGGTFKGASALYNTVFGLKAHNKSMQPEKLKEMLEYFTSGKPLSEEDTVHLFRAVPDRLHTIFPGLVIASVLAEHFESSHIYYADAGVREGFLYDQLNSGKL